LNACSGVVGGRGSSGDAGEGWHGNVLEVLLSPSLLGYAGRLDLSSLGEFLGMGNRWRGVGSLDRIGVRAVLFGQISVIFGRPFIFVTIGIAHVWIVLSLMGDL
jgi:hypothetical protein